MTMPEEDVRLFHRLLFALLDWANTRYAIAPGAPKLAGRPYIPRTASASADMSGPTPLSLANT